MVRKAGIEPAREQVPTDFKSVASTSSAISAQNCGRKRVYHIQKMIGRQAFFAIFGKFLAIF